MAAAHRLPASFARPRLPRRTARLRLTTLYGGLFLLFGGVLVAITYALFEGATAYRTPPIPKVPNAPAIEKLSASRSAGQNPAARDLPGPAAAGPGPEPAGRIASECVRKSVRGLGTEFVRERARSRPGTSS